MTYREIHNAIQNGNEDQKKAALLEMLSYLQITATAVMELAGYEMLKNRDAAGTGSDPLMLRSRINLQEFLELPPLPRT